MSLNAHGSECGFCRGLHWHTYNYLEARLLEASRYVAFDIGNCPTWSETFADLLVLAGSAVDTFFRDMTDCPNVRSSEGFPKVGKAKKDWVMSDFLRVFEPLYELSCNKVTVPFGLGAAFSLEPFAAFSSDRFPSWWNSYNKVKHDYYVGLIKANLQNVLECFGALLILHALHRCSRSYLVKIGRLSDPSHTLLEHQLLEAFEGSDIGYRGRYELILKDLQIVTPVFVYNYRCDHKVV